MPRIPLPDIPAHDVASHKSEKSCYVTFGAKVYDVTSFLPDHPGGGELILQYAGKDVSAIMGDESSHVHSEAAYEILNENVIGFVGKATDNDRISSNEAESVAPADKDVVIKPAFVTTYQSGAQDLTKETAIRDDYETHRFLDLNKPLLAQVWNGGFSKDFYLEQVHRPRYYLKGDSAPLFGNALELLTKVPWYVTPVVWLPIVIWGTIVAYRGTLSLGKTAAYWLLGLFSWTFTEYIIHRAVGHMDRYLPDNRLCITTHFLLHGLHHYLPMDKYRITTSPFHFFVFASPFYRFVHYLIPSDWYGATAVLCGWLFGFACYESTHYFLHIKPVPGSYKQLKKYHLQHHFVDYENGFGVTSRFWDMVFGTELDPPKAAAKAFSAR